MIFPPFLSKTLALISFLMIMHSTVAQTPLDNCNTFKEENKAVKLNCERPISSNGDERWYRAIKDNKNYIVAQLDGEFDMTSYEAMNTGIPVTFINKLGNSPYFYLFAVDGFTILDKRGLEKIEDDVTLMMTNLMRTVHEWQSNNLYLSGTDRFVALYKKSPVKSRFIVLDPRMFASEQKTDSNVPIGRILKAILSSTPTTYHRDTIKNVTHEFDEYYGIQFSLDNVYQKTPKIDLVMFLKEQDGYYKVVFSADPDIFNSPSQMLFLTMGNDGKIYKKAKNQNLIPRKDRKSSSNKDLNDATPLSNADNGKDVSGGPKVVGEKTDEGEKAYKSAIMFAVVVVATLIVLWGYFISKWAGINSRDTMVRV